MDGKEKQFSDSTDAMLTSLEVMLKIHMSSLERLMSGKSLVPIPEQQLPEKPTKKMTRQLSKMAGLDIMKELTKKSFQTRNERVSTKFRMIFIINLKLF